MPSEQLSLWKLLSVVALLASALDTLLAPCTLDVWMGEIQGRVHVLAALGRRRKMLARG